MPNNIERYATIEVEEQPFIMMPVYSEQADEDGNHEILRYIKEFI